MVVRCLDSDLLVGLLRGDEAAVAAARRLDGSEATVRTTAITAYEIVYGARRSGRQENVAEAHKLLGRLEVLPLDATAAMLAAGIMSDLAAKGRMVDLRDVLIAATAMTHNCAVVTRNSKDFAKIKGLVVERW